MIIVSYTPTYINLNNSVRLKFNDLFYAFKHPIYNEIEYRDSRNRALYEKEVKELCDKKYVI